MNKILISILLIFIAFVATAYSSPMEVDDARLQMQDAGGQLISASIHGQIDKVKHLCKPGVTLAVDAGRSLYYAAMFGNLEIVETLLNERSDISVEHVGTALYFGAKYEHLDVVKTILEKRNDISVERIRKVSADTKHQDIIDVLNERIRILTLSPK